MSVNFNSGTNSFSMRLQLLEQRHQKDELWLGAQSSLFGYCVTQGLNTDKVLNSIERDTGYSTGSLSWGRSVSSNDDNDSILFLDNSGSFLEADLAKGTFEHKSERQVTSSFTDWTYGRPYDAYKMDQSGFTFYQLFNSGLNDGNQDSIYLNRVKNDMFKWGLTTVVQMEYGG